MPQILTSYEDRTSSYPYLLDTVKVAEIDITNLSEEEIERIKKVQELNGRRWLTRSFEPQG